MPQYFFKFAPSLPFDSVIFDCDGTLSAIEGVDYLAQLNHTASQVSAITKQCMGAEGLSSKNYATRLDLIKPTIKQLQQLQQRYIQTLAPQAKASIDLLHRLNKTVYVVSAGIRDAIIPLTTALGVADKNVYGVEVFFDSNGDYLDFDAQSPLVTRSCNNTVIERMLQADNRAVLIGDGANDLAAKHSVARFIGYGGAFKHALVMEQAPYYIQAPTFTALRPLLLTIKEVEQLTAKDQYLFQQGFHTITKNTLLIDGAPYV